MKCPTCGHRRSPYVGFHAHELPFSWAHDEADDVVLATAVNFVVDVIRIVIPLAAAAQLAKETP